MYLYEFTWRVLKLVKQTMNLPIGSLDAQGRLSALLNPPDGPSRLVGLPYDDAMTDEAIDAARQLVQGEKEAEFWMIVAFACTNAESLPLQKSDINALP